MAISIDYGALVINVPKADLTLLQSTPTEIRQLDLNLFRLELRSLEDDTEGMAFDRTHSHNTAVTVGGVILSRVIEIINGYTVTFEDGMYAVNLVGANSNVADVVNVNQVSVRSANSAGLQDLSTLLASAYQGVVVVDTVNGQSGTSTPIGTHSTPSNNLTDAMTIADNNGIVDILLMDTITVTEDLSNGYKLTGRNIFTLITIATGANLSNCELKNLQVQGDLLGITRIDNCIISAVTNLAGEVRQCGFMGSCTLSGTLIIIESYSQLQSMGMTILDVGVNAVIVRDFHGSLQLNNVLGNSHSVGIGEGQFTLDSSCIGGVVYLRGTPFAITDNSAGTTLVDQIESQYIKEKVLTTGKFIGLS